MNFQFTHPLYLLLLVPALGWVLWFALKTDVQIGSGRRWIALGIRIIVVLLLVFAIAGLQWRRPLDGMNLFFVLDRSDSVPSQQQEAAENLMYKMAGQKKAVDQAGVIVFGSEAAIDRMPGLAIAKQKIEAVVGTEPQPVL